jgi:hypothetical protein
LKLLISNLLPELIPLNMKILEGKVEQVFFTPQTDQEEKVSTQVDSIECDFEGILGDKHAGRTRMTKGFREQEVFGIDRPKEGKTEVLNWRHWTAVSVEELQIIAERLEIKEFDVVKLARLVGANLLVSGIPNLTHISVGSLLVFPDGTKLKNEGENYPCVNPGIEINKAYPYVKAAHFPTKAWGLRGIVGTVFATGKIQAGETFKIYLREN